MDDRKQFDELFQYGLGTAATVLTIFITVGKVQKLYNVFVSSQFAPHYILQIILCFLTIIIGIGWFTSGKHELNYLYKYFGKCSPPRSFSFLPTIISIAIMIVVLINFCDNLLVYSIISWFYLWGCSYTNWIVSQHIRLALEQSYSKKHVPSKIRNATAKFYLHSNVSTIVYLQGSMIISAIFFAVLSKWFAVSQEQVFNYLTYGYSLQIISMVIGELIIWIRRLILYKKINDKKN